jgi:hypothetical protein
VEAFFAVVIVLALIAIVGWAVVTALVFFVRSFLGLF